MNTIAMTINTGRIVRDNPYVKQLLVERKLKNTDIFKIGGMVMKEAKKNVANRMKIPMNDLKGSDPNIMAEYGELEKNYMKFIDQLVTINTTSI
jgi:hypothetical protein